jgi:hypothetical protein
MAIGTAVEEKYTSLDGLRELIRMQQEQSQGMNSILQGKKYIVICLHRKISPSS